jgi:formyltetrahydrofolate-dependent phosphoribosylglycinamide formyltransferase
MTIPKPKIIILISGNGSNLQAIINAITDNTLNAQISLVVSNKPDAYGLTRASTSKIPTLTFPYSSKTYKSRVEYDLALADALMSSFRKETNGNDGCIPDLIVLAGWMRILSADFINRFPPGRIINLHPALPGAFDGAHAIERAFEAYQKGEITETGCMVHKVIPEVDRGEVILVQRIEIRKEDTLETLEERIHVHEHALIVKGVKKALELQKT